MCAWESNGKERKGKKEEKMSKNRIIVIEREPMKKNPKLQELMRVYS